MLAFATNAATSVGKAASAVGKAAKESAVGKAAIKAADKASTMVKNARAASSESSSIGSTIKNASTSFKTLSNVKHSVGETISRRGQTSTDLIDESNSRKNNAKQKSDALIREIINRFDDHIANHVTKPWENNEQIKRTLQDLDLSTKTYVDNILKDFIIAYYDSEIFTNKVFTFTDLWEIFKENEIIQKEIEKALENIAGDDYGSLFNHVKKHFNTKVENQSSQVTQKGGASNSDKEIQAIIWAITRSVMDGTIKLDVEGKLSNNEKKESIKTLFKEKFKEKFIEDAKFEFKGNILITLMFSLFLDHVDKSKELQELKEVIAVYLNKGTSAEEVIIGLGGTRKRKKVFSKKSKKHNPLFRKSIRKIKSKFRNTRKNR